MSNYIGLYLMMGFLTACFVRFMMYFDDHQHRTAAIALALFFAGLFWPLFWLWMVLASVGEIVRNVRTNLAKGD